MASKRGLRRKQCSRKKRYPDRRHAVSALISLKKGGRRRIHTYHCKFCKGWHIGRRKSRDTRKSWQKSGYTVGVKHMLQSKKVTFLHIYTAYWAKRQ